ncbi:alkene reductase [Streptantibioticus cattleyicolor]|uniref:NADH:flavin oxidoreductase/NADH oxidase n=1 Tax=Streptantibioticus cattleyicolor (strain ATCC 35852 / DSM 46488 / JCM 4925 / NBRC 14057 / NRRL 8057) TaxID=1003195 RepID=F8JLB2_STREN|nr:alkene reductase [Streptantibioticus cattleyicolor]AEW99602.1 NADH:flavin oxidoreductase/NADH oxidase [Streptantibioticus cattleyicolor NRRL 8057 = DSM 46488]CCB71361.1 N-ethylmaleimide reductase [Streptantibioticus cattleyicolor NRRL 8057 = DSM 46488]
MTNTAARSALFEPARLGPLHLPNRLVMAPLTRNRAGADGVPGPLMTTYYTQRASAGLIIAEATTPNAVGQTYPNIPALHGAHHVAGWRRVNDAVRAAGGRMVVQLQHGGRVGHPDNSGLTPVAPSPVALPETIHTPSGRQPSVVPREMTTDDIRSTVADFAAAARNAVATGFEGVEVHSANGHLLHQFLAENTNRRTDAYGGPVSRRVRFVVEVAQAVADAIGPERVGLRISPGNTVNGIAEGDTGRIYPELVAALAGLDLAYLHIVFADPDQPLFRDLRAAWPTALIANPALGHGPLPADGGRRAGERLLDAGADLIAFGRGFLANPDFVARLRTGAPLNPVREAYTMYTGGETGYTDYPTLPATVAHAVPAGAGVTR